MRFQPIVETNPMHCLLLSEVLLIYDQILGSSYISELNRLVQRLCREPRLWIWCAMLWLMQHGPVYKLAFGPKAFVVVSDPIVARHILRENTFSYDKVCLGLHGSFHDFLEPSIACNEFFALNCRFWTLVCDVHPLSRLCCCGLTATFGFQAWLNCLGFPFAGRNQGVLADILEPIMGKGLIPADLETWKVRRRGLPSVPVL